MNVIRRVFYWLLQHKDWLKWPVAAGLLGTLFYFNWDSLKQVTQRDIRWGYFLAGFALCAVTITLSFVRWFLLVWAQEFPFHLRDAMRLGFVGYLFNYVGPGAVGGDLCKAVMIAREQASRRVVAVATIFLDRLLGLLALLLVGSAAALLQPELLQSPLLQTVAWTFWGSALAGIAGVSMAMIPGITKHPWIRAMEKLPVVGRFAGSLLEALALYQSKPQVVLLAILLSIVGHGGMLTAFYCCALSLNAAENVPGYFAHLLFIPAAELAAMVPLVPGGVGALEGAVAYFYQVAGAEFSDGILTGLAYRAITIIIAALAGGYYFTMRREMSAALQDSGCRLPDLAGNRAG